MVSLPKCGRCEGDCAKCMQLSGQPYTPFPEDDTNGKFEGEL